jgi:hypothetical protein
MSFEEKATSSALSLIDALEAPAQTRVRVFAAAGGALVTIIMWVVHLTYPEIFTYLLGMDSWLKLVVGGVLAPPFVLAFAAGSFIYSQPIESKETDKSGPMSTYFYQERSSRRWKLLIVAALIAAANFVLMMVSCGF